MKKYLLVAHAGLLTIISIVLVAYAVHGSIPQGAVRLPGNRYGIASVLPEGWAFFSRTPREERFLVYVSDGDGWHRAIGVQAQWRDGLGLRRTVRALNIEAGLLLQSVRAWNECTDDPAICLLTAKVEAEVNTTPHPSLCGDIALVQQTRTPWAWAESSAKIVMPSRIARLSVQC